MKSTPILVELSGCLARHKTQLDFVSVTAEARPQTPRTSRPGFRRYLILG
jgi:hypothetical protein